MLPARQPRQGRGPMSTELDGTYSVIAASVKGGAIGVATIRDGAFEARDSGGAIYTGSASRNQLTNTVHLDLTIRFPPDTFGIWGTTPSETGQERAMTIVIPGDNFDNGYPYTEPGYGLTVIFVRVPDEFANRAGPDGFRMAAEILLDADRYWRS